MRKISIIVCALLITAYQLSAQAPAFFNYQGVARNSVGSALVNQVLTLRLTIHDGGGGAGASVYSETRTVTTNAFGLFSVQVGGPGATNITGSMANINWKSGSKFMQVEIDPEGGSSFKDVGTTRLTSVPYSLYTNLSGDIVLPFFKSQNDDGILFKVINSGNTEISRAIEGATNSQGNNVSAIRGVVTSVSPGSFSAGVIGQNNGTGNNGIGVYGAHNGAGWGVYGTAQGGVGVYGNSTSGIGVYGQSAASGPSVMGFKDGNGLGNAGLFQNSNTANTFPVVSVQSNGTGDAVNIGMSGTGNGINVQMTGSGSGAVFNTNNSGSFVPVLSVSGNGLGRSGYFQNTNAANTSNILEVSSNGTGRIGLFQNTNAGNTADALTSITNGSGWSFRSTNTGTNGAGIFTINNASNNSSAALRATTNGLSRSAFFDITNNASTANALEVATNGTGYAALIQSTNASAKALRTVGALQFTGISEGPFKVLSTVDGSGNATWQSAASVGLVSGSGTLNYVPKWTPDGTIIGNSQVFDNGANVGINTTTPTAKLYINGNFIDSAVTTGFAATFINNDNGNGDGIKIKLGKAKSIYSPPAIPALIDGGVATNIQNLIRCDFPGNKISLLSNIVLSGALEDLQVIGGLAVGTGNLIINKINATLGLPLKIGPYGTPEYTLIPYTTIFGGWGIPFGPDIPAIHIGPYTIPELPVIPEVTVMPSLPNIDLGGLGIPSIPITDLSFWGIPTDFCLNDAPGSTPLNNANEFIRFTDKNDAKMGSIRAVSVTDWANNYLNPLFLYKLYGALTSSKADKFHAQYHFKSELTTALKDYASLGVEYASGNGDYAEWLERTDNKELITPGDIVAVSGGKITKDLACAEQVMVVSHQPIVLGNVPKEGQSFSGNNIAFMGQVPVKVLGPVSTGDYIVGQSSTPGYGIAKHPDQMSIEDFKYAVGRSWDNDLADGPKMVNTVVGIHNGDYLKILKGFESKFNESELRLKTLEQKVAELIKSNSERNRKPF